MLSTSVSCLAALLSGAVFFSVHAAQAQRYRTNAERAFPGAWGARP